MESKTHEDQARRIAELEARPRLVKVHIGTSALSCDLVWCECDRGLSRSGKWEFCPSCGGRIDQYSYLIACELAERNGATNYRNVEDVEIITAQAAEIARLKADASRERMMWRNAIQTVTSNPEDIHLIGMAESNDVRAALSPIIALSDEVARLKAKLAEAERENG